MRDGSQDAEAALDATAQVPADQRFASFFEVESATLYSRLCLITGNRSEAEEIMQDAFMKLWERWDRVASLEDPTGYLYRTAMNIFRKRYRRARLELRKVVRPGLARDEFVEAEVRTEVGAALAALPPRQRAVLVLTELLGFTSEDAGKVLGIKPGSVRSLATHGRAALKLQLGDEVQR